MSQLVDITVLADMQRRGMRVDEIASIAPDEPTALSAATVSELMVTLHRAKSGPARAERQGFIGHLLAAFPVLPFSEKAAEAYAEALVIVSSGGGLIRASDLMVAATAVANDYALLTDNVRDFERIPDLELRQPTWPS